MNKVKRKKKNSVKSKETMAKEIFGSNLVKLYARKYSYGLKYIHKNTHAST